jgi:uncharacterized protein YndB with AHSA1/START domain
MLKKILFALVVIVVVLGVVIAVQPSDLRVARSATIAAPPADVFAQVNDFHNWDAWSPWAKLDPKATNSFEGSSSGKGAIFKWSGNHEVGKGSMTVTESQPNELIRIKLDFVEPFEGTNTAEFTFKPQGDQTLVTWTMTGQKNFVCKAIGLFMNMDKMIGDKFEEGLANMKSVVEAKKGSGKS